MVQSSSELPSFSGSNVLIFGGVKKVSWRENGKLGGCFNYLLFSSLGEMIQFDEHIFQMGWNHQVPKKTPNEDTLTADVQGGSSIDPHQVW